MSDAAGRLERGEPWEVRDLLHSFGLLNKNQEIEATLHCLDLVNEAVDLDALAREAETGSTSGAFTRLFGGDLWGRLPTSAVAPPHLYPSLREQAQEKAAINRLRKTALQVVGAFLFLRAHVIY